MKNGWRVSRLGYRAGLFSCLFGVWVAAAPADDGAAAPPPVDLLHLPAAHLERSNVGLDSAAKIPALFDGDPSSSVTVRAASTAPFDLVFGFGDEMVTAERLVVQLPQEAPPARVEILGSTLSAQAGFRSLRSDPLKSISGAQSFAFQPAGAHWIMLRFTPAAGQQTVAVAEVQVFGRAGAPVSNYAFKQSPAAAFDVLARLKSLSTADTALSADERSLFADAADGRLDQWSLEDAALIASGVPAADRRALYLAGLTQIEAAAARAVGSAGTPFDRGGRLLKWLYQSGALKSYSKDQTDLSALLEDGRYNCVSSALLYALIAQRLGLDVRAVEVPDHAFAVLYDGMQHADVETTVESGFNPDRDPKSLGLFQRLTGFKRPPAERAELRREVGVLALVGVVYYNRGVADGQAGRYVAALSDYFRALSLDPESAQVVQNTLGILANWSIALVQAKKFQEAVQELSVGLALAPADAALGNNQLYAWQQWASSEIQAGHRDAALDVLRNAAQAAPQGGFEAMQTWVYISPAQDLAKREDWDAALAIVDPVRGRFQGQQLADMENYEASLYNQKGQQLIAHKRWAEAQAVYAAAEARLPGVAMLRQNESYVWANWCIEADSAGDFATALDVAVKGHRRFPDEPVLSGNEKAAWLQLASRQVQQADFTAALASLDKAAADFPDDADVRQDALSMWVNWCWKLMDGGQLQQGVEVCERGLKAYPGNESLRNNEHVGWFRAGKAHYDAGQWQQALDTYSQAQEYFPGDHGLADNELSVWVNWSKSLLDAGQWQQAVEVAQRGLKRQPDAELLKGNELAAWVNWARALSGKNDWAGASTVAERGLQHFPNEKNLLSVRAISQDHLGDMKVPTTAASGT